MGRPKTTIWWCRYDCDRARTYRDEKDPNLSPSKRRKRSKRSIKVVCPAHFTASCKQGPNGSAATVVVKYWSVHEGHEAGTLQDFATSMMPRAAREWLQERVAQGLDWRAIKPFLRLDDDTLDKVSSDIAVLYLSVADIILLDFEGNIHLPETLRISQADVYNTIRKRITNLSRLDKDCDASITLWKKDLEGKGYHMLFERLPAERDGGFVIALASPWQVQVRTLAFIITDSSANL
jgi:hypothetical protein